MREPSKEKSVWYFAYGSNMNKDDLDKWCKKKGYPQITLTSPARATLLNHKLSFTHCSRCRKGGVADIVFCEGNAVEGILCRITESDLKRIDKKEGAPNVYRRKNVSVALENGTTKHAITYEACQKEGPFLPSREYMSIIIEGAKAHRLSKNYISKLEKIKVKEC